MSDTTSRPHLIYGSTDDLPEIVFLQLEKIQPDPNQPRKAFNQEKLEELAAAIREQGLLQPITVRPNPAGEGYLVVMGERRFQAHKHLGLEKIQAVIRRDIDEVTAFELALIENVQREDLSPFEEAAGYARLMEEYNYTQEQVAERVGKARSTVTNILTLRRLPEKVKAEVTATNRVSKSVLLEIARLESEADQLRMWERIKKQPTTTRTAREEKQGKKVAPVKASEQKKRLSETIKLGGDFQRRLEKVDRSSLSAHRKEFEKLRAIYERIGEILMSAESSVVEESEASAANVA